MSDAVSPQEGEENDDANDEEPYMHGILCRPRPEVATGPDASRDARVRVRTPPVPHFYGLRRKFLIRRGLPRGARVDTTCRPTSGFRRRHRWFLLLQGCRAGLA